jgi:hypothetical protein
MGERTESEVGCGDRERACLGGRILAEGELTKKQLNRLRAEREALLARYDGSALPPAVADCVRLLEVEVAWHTHKVEQRGGAG